MAEVEVETSWVSQAKVRQKERFLKGPIPLARLQQAATLPGKALATYLAVLHQRDLSGRVIVTLSAALLTSFGIDRDAKARALRALEQAGLIAVEHAPGRSARIKIV
jgi:DNA-binding MarR family transcriptional regulator